MPKKSEADELYRQLDAAIVLSVRKDWEFRNPDTGQRFILSLMPVGDSSE